AKELGLDVVVPVPLHWTRYWWRGYNQCAAVARGVARKVGLPLQTRWLSRPRYTQSQTSLSGSARRNNLKDAFRVRRDVALAGRRVLLIDDVLTTGATAHEAARALKSAGAAQVVVGVLARAGLGTPQSPLLNNSGDAR